MKVNTRVEEGLHAVREAEKAVIQAQYNSSPGTYQEAHHGLMSALDKINQLIGGVHSEEERIKLQTAKEHLRNLFETNDALR